MARPRRVRTTDSRHDFPIAPNLLARNFTATAPNNGKCELPHTRKAFSQIQLPPDIEFKLTLKACLKGGLLDLVQLGSERLSKNRSAIAEAGLLDFFDPA